MSVCASVVARIYTIAWYWTNDDMIVGVALLPLHWLKKWMTSTTSLGRRTHPEHIFLSDDKYIMWWGYQPPRVWRRGHASQSSHHQLSQLANRWHRQLLSECSSPELRFFTSMTLAYILFFMLERMNCVDAACTLSVTGLFHPLVFHS